MICIESTAKLQKHTEKTERICDDDDGDDGDDDDDDEGSMFVERNGGQTLRNERSAVMNSNCAACLIRKNK